MGLVNRFGDEELTAKEPLPVGRSKPMSTQSKNVQGAGNAERQEDWTLESILWDYAENKSLSRRKRKFLASYMERTFRLLSSQEPETVRLSPMFLFAPNQLCHDLGADLGCYWIDLGTLVLEELEVPYYNIEEWRDGIRWIDGRRAIVISNGLVRSWSSPA